MPCEHHQIVVPAEAEDDLSLLQVRDDAGFRVGVRAASGWRLLLEFFREELTPPQRPDVVRSILAQEGLDERNATVPVVTVLYRVVVGVVVALLGPLVTE